LDGSVICICFEDGDLGFVLGLEENERILQKFGAGRKGATLPEGTESVRLEERARDGERREVEGRMGELMMDGAGTSGQAGDTPMANSGITAGPQWQMQQAPEADKTAAVAETQKEKPYKQKVTLTKDGKKRVAPLLVST
jgi:protein HIRA/HIR1